jgi:predicted phage terminase large subunit-like protein
MWKPTPGPQAEFVVCGAKEALYGGAAGGGKSAALLMAAARYVSSHHYRALLLRNTKPELKRTLVVDSKKIYPSLGGKYRADEFTWVFPGDGPNGEGGVIEFGFLDSDDDVEKYQGIPNLCFLGYDELVHFSEYQYKYMFSRLRSAHGIPCYVRATSNPGSAGHHWVLKRFAPWLYPEGHHGYKGLRAKPQQRLWYTLDEDEADDVLLDRQPGGGEEPPPDAYARVYFPAKVSDNPYYRGTDYEKNLDRLPPLQRKRLRDGDWMAEDKKGEYYKREWFRVVKAIPAEVDVRVRYWDRASSSKPKGKVTRSKKKRRDFTAGLKLVRLPSGLFIVEDVRRFQARPLAVKEAIVNTATADTAADPACYTFLELDPGQAGQSEAEFYSLVPELQEAGVRFCPPQGGSKEGEGKLIRARAPSAQAEAGNIAVLEAEWNGPFFDELEEFPEGHDDQADVLAGAFRQALALSSFRQTQAGCQVIDGEDDGEELPDDEDDELLDDELEDEDDADEQLKRGGMSAENLAYWKSWGGTVH